MKKIFEKLGQYILQKKLVVALLVVFLSPLIILCSINFLKWNHLQTQLHRISKAEVLTKKTNNARWLRKQFLERYRSADDNFLEKQLETLSFCKKEQLLLILKENLLPLKI